MLAILGFATIAVFLILISKTAIGHYRFGTWFLWYSVYLQDLITKN